MTTPVLEKPPGLIKRLSAMGYDAFLVFALLFAATGLLLIIDNFLLGGSSPALQEGDVVNELPTIASGPFFTAYLIIVMYLFYAYFWCKLGQSLGMQAWRLRVDSQEGGRISMKQASIRFAGAWVSFLCFGLGYFWILFDKEKRAWHDIWSGTRIVQLAKK